MVSFVDQAILLSALGAFLSFVIIFILVFRFVKNKDIFKRIMNVFGWGAAMDILLGYLFFSSDLLGRQDLPVSLSVKLFGLAVSLFLYGILSFLYVLCVFGPYESSVRLRLIREFSSVYPGGLRYGELLRCYNNRNIIDRRLDRLVESKELEFDGRHYRKRKKQSFFLVADFFAKVFKKITQ
ncbi:MAG: hypothetical protein WC552_02455 [Candidatus Omnitrophota bacterium]